MNFASRLKIDGVAPKSPEKLKMHAKNAAVVNLTTCN